MGSDLGKGYNIDGHNFLKMNYKNLYICVCMCVNVCQLVYLHVYVCEYKIGVSPDMTCLQANIECLFMSNEMSNIAHRNRY